jgi:penicillin-binding protein 1A
VVQFIRRIILFLTLDFAALATAYYVLPNTAKLQLGATLDRTTTDGRHFPFIVGPKNKNYVRLSSIPRPLWMAVLELEDAKFYQHLGFDLDEILNALGDYVQQGKRLRGASTLSQQLVKNLYLTPERSFRRKILEAMITIKLELTLPKNKILEIYLNSIDWGRGLFGIADAAQYYFKKKVSNLNVRECVFLAAIVPNPTRFGKMAEDQLPKKFVRIQMMRALEALYSSGEIGLEDYQRVMAAPYEFKNRYEFEDEKNL